MDRGEARNHFNALATRSLSGRLLGCGFAERCDRVSGLGMRVATSVKGNNLP
jgi:hypothetical protein